MATLEEVREQLAGQAAELEKLPKQLKKPSTISFAERQSLSGRATRSLAEVQEQLAVLEPKSEGDEGLEALLATAQEVLERAEGVLGAVDAALPARQQRPGGGFGQGLPGQQRRGVSGLSQQRAPNRSGSE